MDGGGGAGQDAAQVSLAVDQRGLSITYGIVEKLGGQIGVKSAPGQGTSFTVTLPVRRAGE